MSLYNASKILALLLKWLNNPYNMMTRTFFRVELYFTKVMYSECYGDQTLS